MTGKLILELLLVAGAYLLGSVPFGLLLSRTIAGVDVRDVGSGNIGAANVARAAGRWVGILTLVLDAAKAAIPILIARSVLGMDRALPWVTAVALAAFAGHLFPVWLKFRGGKGVATALGVFLVLTPWMALVGLVAFAIGFAATRISAVGSLAGTLVCAGGVFFTYGAKSPITWGVCAVAVAIVVRHRSNIIRLLQGSENKV